MSGAGWRLTRRSFDAGRWEGELTGPSGAAAPAIVGRLDGHEVARAVVETRGPGRWTVRLDFDARIVGEGRRTVLIGPQDAAPLAAEVIGFSAAPDAGTAAEIADLRTEVALLKKVLRRLVSGRD